MPSTFMLVPGPWQEASEVVQVLANEGIEAMCSGEMAATDGSVKVSMIESDFLPEAFSWGRRGATPKDLMERVAASRYAAVVEINRWLDHAPAILSNIGRALRNAGGIAVRMEASGGASAWEPWLEQLESGDPADLYACGVLIVSDDDGTFFTCGMHHFGLPDAQIALEDSEAALAWLDAFCVFQISEQPGIASGHTFRPDAETPRRTLERWPDHRHSPDDGRHNPFGVWRILPEDERSVEASKLVLVIVPPLVETLSLAETSARRSLSQSEVADLVSKGAAIAMPPKDAIALERSRGFADIEPELAWEQWQIVRAWAR